MHIAVAITPLAAMLAASGCVAPGRIADLQECARLSVGFGGGLNATARAGLCTDTAIGFGSEMLRVGHETRKVSGLWKEEEVVFFPAWLVLCRLSYMRLYHGEDDGRHGYWLPIAEYWRHTGEPEVTWYQLLMNFGTDLEAGLALGLVGVRAGFNPLEAFDFVLGLFGFDIARDDSHHTDEGDDTNDTGESEPNPIAPDGRLHRWPPESPMSSDRPSHLHAHRRLRRR